MIYHNNRIQIGIITLKIGDTVYSTPKVVEFNFTEFGKRKQDPSSPFGFTQYGSLEMYYIYFLRNKEKLNESSLVSKGVYVFQNSTEIPQEQNSTEHLRIAIARRNGIIEFMFPNNMSGSLISNSPIRSY